MACGTDPDARVYFHTLGCPKNDADSRSLMRRLAEGGAIIVEDPAECTHMVINTCGFIQDAKEESIEAILEACGAHPGAKVVVTGCLVERYREELAQGIPEVAAWFGADVRDAGEGIAQAVLGACASCPPRQASVAGEVSSYAYLKISDGCDEGCTFCAIPGFKGPYYSVPLGEVLREADACLAAGARELVLVGQETTRWSDDGTDLRGLIDALGADTRVRRIRVMYLQPARVEASFLSFMAAHDKLCKYLDLPFQHSHRDVLLRMGRRGEAGSYLALLEQARALMPDVKVRSTFIVGFPGETQKHFDHLCAFVRSARFDYGGAFVYSPEEGTSAALLRPTVKRQIGQRRLGLLNEILLEVGERERERSIGREVEIMVDSVDGDDLVEGSVAVGRTEGQAPEVDGVTYLRGARPEALTPGDVVLVKISDVIGCDLVGDLLAP